MTKELKRKMHQLLDFPTEAKNKLVCRLHRVKCGKECHLKGNIHIVNRGTVEIGNGVIINSGNKYDPIGFDNITNIITGKNAIISIGNNVGISNSTIYSTNSIIISNNVLFGNGVKVYDTDFHSLDSEWRGKPGDKEHTVSKPVVIDDDVFIGAGSIILKGVHIGKKSVIGAGSVVTKDVPDNEIWAGNPAKKIR